MSMVSGLTWRVLCVLVGVTVDGLQHPGHGASQADGGRRIGQREIPAHGRHFPITALLVHVLFGDARNPAIAGRNVRRPQLEGAMAGGIVRGMADAKEEMAIGGSPDLWTLYRGGRRCRKRRADCWRCPDDRFYATVTVRVWFGVDHKGEPFRWAGLSDRRNLSGVAAAPWPAVTTGDPARAREDENVISCQGSVADRKGNRLLRWPPGNFRKEASWRQGPRRQPRC